MTIRSPLNGTGMNREHIIANQYYCSEEAGGEEVGGGVPFAACRQGDEVEETAGSRGDTRDSDSTSKY